MYYSNIYYIKKNTEQFFNAVLKDFSFKNFNEHLGGRGGVVKRGPNETQHGFKLCRQECP